MHSVKLDWSLLIIVWHNRRKTKRKMPIPAAMCACFPSMTLAQTIQTVHAVATRWRTHLNDQSPAHRFISTQGTTTVWCLPCSTAHGDHDDGLLQCILYGEVMFKPKCTIATYWNDPKPDGNPAIARNKFGGFECEWHHSLPRPDQPRSEERRVGKECRSRWS